MAYTRIYTRCRYEVYTWYTYIHLYLYTYVYRYVRGNSLIRIYLHVYIKYKYSKGTQDWFWYGTLPMGKVEFERGGGVGSRALEASSSQSSVINYTQNEYWREALIAAKDNTIWLGQVHHRLLAIAALYKPIKNLKIGSPKTIDA